MARLNGGGGTSGGIADVYVVASEAAMLALPATQGDVAVRTDIDETFILAVEPATVLGNWQIIYTANVIGTGAAGQVANFVGVRTISSYANFLYDDTNHNLTQGETINLTSPTHGFASGGGHELKGTYNTLLGLNCDIGASNHHHNIVAGSTLVANGSDNAVFGSAYSVQGGYNVSGGWNHGTITGDYNAQFGQQHDSTTGNQNIVAGVSNDVDCNFSAVFGSSHNIDANGCIVGGIQNSVSINQHYGAVFGRLNAVTGGRVLVGGEGHTVAGAYNLVGGWVQSVSAAYNISAGQSNTISAGGYSAMFGRSNQTSSSDVLVYGNSNDLNGQYSAMGGNNNSGAGSRSFTHGENIANATNYAGAFGAEHTIGGNYALVGGNDNTLTAVDYAFAFGHLHNVTTTATYSSVLGKEAEARMYGQNARASGKFTNAGDAQTSKLTMRRTTPDATPLELSLDGQTNYISTEDDKAYYFTIKIVARNIADSTKTGMYKLEFGFDRATGVASVRLHGVIKTILHEDIGAWDVNVSADTTNGRPAIMVTGAASTDIHWFAKVEMEEVN